MEKTLKKKVIIMTAVSVGLIGLFGTLSVNGLIAKHNADVHINDCKTPAGQNFNGVNAILIRKIAAMEAENGNDGFICQ